MARIDNLAKASEASTTNRRGNLLYKPGTRSINLCGKGYTVGRILPGQDPDVAEKCFDDFRIGHGYGKWVETIPIVKGFLPDTKNIVFIMYDRLDYNASDATPYKELYFALKRAQKEKVAKAEWLQLLVDGRYGKPLPRWTDGYFCHFRTYWGDIYNPDVNRDKNHPDREIPPEEWNDTDVLLLTTSAWNNLNTLLKADEEEAEMLGAEPLDLSDPSKGTFVGFWMEARNQALPGARRVQNSEGQFQGYGVGVWDTFPLQGRYSGRTAEMSQLDADRVLEKTKPWEEVLNFMTYEEQAKMLAEHLPEDLLRYAWNSFPSWIEAAEEVWSRKPAAPQYGAPAYQQPPYPPTYPPQGYPQAAYPPQPQQWYAPAHEAQAPQSPVPAPSPLPSFHEPGLPKSEPEYKSPIAFKDPNVGGVDQGYPF